MLELLAPAGDIEKLKTALHFGADAVYFSGKNYGLRAFSANFDEKEIKKAVEYVHEAGKKAYVTLNIFAKNKDFKNLTAYLKVLTDAKVDAVIVSDLGMFSFIKENAPSLTLHVSTQANTTNKYSAKAWADMGAKRIILARELTLNEIKEITDFVSEGTEVEVFVHGAMCISYSGRCLLSNYMANRDSNRGECVQSCRWNYALMEKSRDGQYFEIDEDKNGTYILNSKDMCMIEYLNELKKAGVTSFKIEGRMKSSYYVATVVNAYRRAIDDLNSGNNNKNIEKFKDELAKASHRLYTTGFMVDDGDLKQNYKTSHQTQSSDFVAVIRSVNEAEGNILVEQRNRFMINDELEILSPTFNFGKKIKITEMWNKKGKNIQDAKIVQELVYIKTDIKGLVVGDILRK